MKTRIFLFCLLSSLVVAAAPIEEGKAIFSTRCAGCHNVNKILTGPALAGVDERRSIDWIINFVHSSQSMIKNGDKDAVDLFQKFNKVAMPDHPDLTAENIKSIVAYIKTEVKPETAAPFSKPSTLLTPYRPLSIKKDAEIFLIYLAVVGLLVGLLLMVVRMTEYRVMSGNTKTDEDQVLQQ